MEVLQIVTSGKIFLHGFKISQILFKAFQMYTQDDTKIFF